MNKYAAVILAAGYSSRMQRFKPLLDIGGVSAIERLIRGAREAGVHHIIVVTGHNREALLPVLRQCKTTPCGLVQEVYNPDFAQGMFSSIQTGLRHAKEAAPDLSGVFLMPVDCPLISSHVLRKLKERREEGRDSRSSAMNSCADCFYVPVFEGKKGHPLLIPTRYFGEICDYDGAGGLKAITDHHWDKIIRVPVDEEGCVMDMDTPEGYEEIVAFFENGCRRESLQKLAAGRRIVLVRHGETRQHDEKMFIGRYDVPLDEDAAPQVAAMAAELMGRLLEGRSKDAVLYTSPLQRAGRTAEIMASVFNEASERRGFAWEIRQIDALQEIALGDWDGKAISQIKAQYPAEYERRGKELFSFKIGNKAENFYDVQYRAVKALRKILTEDRSRNIILVTHSAVIRALENNLCGMRVDDPWEKLPKGSFRVIEVPLDVHGSIYR